MSAEHGPIQHHDPREGFDRGEPAARSIVVFAIGSIVLLILTIVAIQQYFDKIWRDAVYEKVLVVPSEQLRELRNRDDWNLTHYGYMDKKSGVVRIPVDRAMELFLQESAQGKLFYPAKPTAPKKEEPTVVPGAAPAPAPMAAPAP